MNQLLQAGYPTTTVSIAECTGNFKSEDTSLSTHFSITDYKVANIKIVCNDDDVEKIVHVIFTFGRTGNHGDGIIFVAKVEKCTR